MTVRFLWMKISRCWCSYKRMDGKGSVKGKNVKLHYVAKMNKLANISAVIRFLKLLRNIRWRWSIMKRHIKLRRRRMVLSSEMVHRYLRVYKISAVATTNSQEIALKACVNCCFLRLHVSVSRVDAMFCGKNFSILLH